MDVQRTTALLPAFHYMFYLLFLISCLIPITSTFSRKVLSLIFYLLSLSNHIDIFEKNLSNMTMNTINHC